MNIRRFVAPNSRSALREVRTVLGGDAVIISNRPTPEGVEIMAAAAGELSRIADSVRTMPSQVPNVGASPLQGTEPAVRAAPARVRSGTEPQAAAAGTVAQSWMSDAQVVRTRQRIATLLALSGEGDACDADQASESDAEPIPDVVSRLASEPRARMPQPSFLKAPAAPAGLSLTAAAPAGLSGAAEAARSGPAERTSPAFTKPPSIQSKVVSAGASSSHASEGIADEMRSMRGFIEEQLASFAWTETMRRQPGRMRLMQDLIGAGFSPSLSRHLQQNLPDDFSHAQGRSWTSEVLERNLNCGASHDDLLDQGGVFALVGPTGVGKTTTAAKLAARFALKHGADQLALITTDAYRIGAQDQLRIYGKILGIAVQTIHDQASLSSALQYLGKKKLVLIDTAGLGQRDERVAEQFAMLRGTNAKRLLVLNATVQAETLEEVVGAYGHREFNGCVLTKIDEAVRLGAVLDVVIRHRLRVQYVTNGQRVPEDLHHPNPKYLVHRALRETAPSRVFHVQAEDESAWLAAIAQSACETSTRRVRHV